MIRQLEFQIDRQNKSADLAKALFNVIAISIIAVYGVMTALIIANFEDFTFMLRRKDIMSAARRVEQEEQKIIEGKIQEIRKESLKKILSPVAQN